MPATSKVRKGTSRSKRTQGAMEDLRLAAYYRWLSRGCPPGDDLTDWVAVEQELLEEGKARAAHDI